MDINDEKSNEVVFFFGAGASVAAGVPTTYQFVSDFKSYLENETEHVEVLISILARLERHQKDQLTEGKVDVELLLETLTKLSQRKNDPILEFYDDKKFCLDDDTIVDSLIQKLKDFIKQRAIVTENKVFYLRPFIDFLSEYKKVHVVSVNYDICIEQFCAQHRINYTDGFDVYWNPQNFESESTRINLYKIHGSVTWYQSNRGRYLKLPVMNDRSELTLITGEKAQNLMLYPMRKFDYAEPILELLITVKNLLQKANFLVVVGYSFRDDHIRNMIWDIANSNLNLKIILIDPYANDIYNERLKYYDPNSKTESALSGKVVCLPYNFEWTFQYLKNQYIKELESVLNDEESAKKRESNGHSQNWAPLIKRLIDVEYFEKAETLIYRVEDFSTDFELCFKLNYYFGIHYWRCKNEKKAKEFFEKAEATIYQYFYNPEIEISSVFPFVYIKIHLLDDRDRRNDFDYIRLSKIFKEIEQFISLNKYEENFYILDNLNLMIYMFNFEYINGFNSIKLTDYLSKREKLAEKNQDAKDLTDKWGYLKSGQHEIDHEGLKQAIQKLEKTLIASYIN